MKSGKCNKCERCSAEDVYSALLTIHHIERYPIFRECWDKWANDGYGGVWSELYHVGSCELADKFILDFLGRLG